MTEPPERDRGTGPSSDSPLTDVDRLRQQNADLRRERDELRRQLEPGANALAAAELKLLAATLSKEVKSEFLESVKRGLWAVAVVATIATAGGVLTISDILKSRIDAAIDGRHQEIEKLRSGVLDALIDVRTQAKAALAEVDGLKSATAGAARQVTELQQRVAKESEQAISHIRGVTLSFTSNVDSSGRTSTSVAAQLRETPRAGAEPSPAPPRDADQWFGAVPAAFVGISGSAFNEIGKEESQRGAFSVKFQAALVDPKADADANGQISLREAVRATAARLKDQKPVLVGDSADVALFSIAAPANAQKPRRKIHAVLVGISKYPTAPLSGPVNDVRAFAKLLEDRQRLLATDVQVSLFLDRDATGDAIERSVDSIARVSSADDIFLLYFSGHQSNLPDVHSSTNSLLKTLVPVDFEKGRFILVPDLVKRVGKINAKVRVIIADV